MVGGVAATVTPSFSVSGRSRNRGLVSVREAAPPGSRGGNSIAGAAALVAAALVAAAAFAFLADWAPPPDCGSAADFATLAGCFPFSACGFEGSAPKDWPTSFPNMLAKATASNGSPRAANAADRNQPTAATLAMAATAPFERLDHGWNGCET